MNFYWGDSPMSWLRYMTLVSFRYHNPDEPIVLHTSSVEPGKPWRSEHMQDFMGYAGDDWRTQLPGLGVEMREADNYGAPNHSMDMCRWKVLAEGGQFADMDIIWTAPLPELSGDALTCVNGVFFLGLTSGAPGGFFADIYERARHRSPDTYQSYGVHALYEAIYGESIFNDGEMRWRYLYENQIPWTGDHIPREWVHPFLWGEVFDAKVIPDCYGIHWFAGSEEGQRATRAWSPLNIGGGAMGKAIQRVMT